MAVSGQFVVWNVPSPPAQPSPEPLVEGAEGRVGHPGRWRRHTRDQPPEPTLGQARELLRASQLSAQDRGGGPPTQPCGGPAPICSPQLNEPRVE